jgi:alpha-L-arabinofuranosidase
MRVKLITSLVLAVVLLGTTAYTSYMMPGVPEPPLTELRLLAGAGADPSPSAYPSVLGASVDWTDDCQGLYNHVSGLLEPEPVGELISSDPAYLRFPAGGLSQSYNWTHGVGTSEQRGTNPSHGPRPQRSYFGTDEFMALINHTGARPVIVVNAAENNPREAADWVSYCNDVYWRGKGPMRTQNGHLQPYAIKYWEIGFEMHQSQYWESDADQTTPAGVRYANLLMEYSRAMKAVDPTILVGATLVLHSDVESASADMSWNINVLNTAKGTFSPNSKLRYFDYVTVTVKVPRLDVLLDAPDMFAYSYARTYETLQEDLAQLRGLLYFPNEVPIAISSFVPDFTSRGWNTDAPAYSGSAVITANIAMEALRSAASDDPRSMLYACYGDISSRSYSALLVNPDFAANAGGTWQPSPSYIALDLCSVLQGMVSVEVARLRAAEYSMGGERSLPAIRGVPIVDAIAGISADGLTARAIIVNREVDGPSRVVLSVEGWSGLVSVTRTVISSESLRSTNLLGEGVRTVSEGWRSGEPKVEVEVPRASVMLLELERSAGGT